VKNPPNTGRTPKNIRKPPPEQFSSKTAPKGDRKTRKTIPNAERTEKTPPTRMYNPKKMQFTVARGALH